MQYGAAVEYDNGNEKVLALVTKHHEDDTLDLVTFPTSSPVEHVSAVPRGEGGRTWQPKGTASTAPAEVADES